MSHFLSSSLEAKEDEDAHGTVVKKKRSIIILADPKPKLRIELWIMI